MEFKVSVVIPVYNAAQYVEQAVESAVHLEEVGEILLVEDGSPDNALKACKDLEEKYSKVILMRHEGGANKGAGASRNLGIKNSSFDYIAFLDADDWYLPERFVKDSQIFGIYPDADGVYGATGFYYQDRKHLWLDKLTTLRKRVAPDQLIFSLLDGNGGHFTTNAITLKRTFLEKVGMFDEKLTLHQDTHLWFRCAVKGKLYAGKIEEAVAIRRVHEGNRIIRQSEKSHYFFSKSLYHSILELDVERVVFILVLKRYVGKKTKSKILRYIYVLIEVLKRPFIIFKMF